MLVLGEHISMEFSSKYKNGIQENAFENVVCEIVAILSQPQGVKSTKHIIQ